VIRSSGGSNGTSDADAAALSGIYSGIAREPRNADFHNILGDLMLWAGCIEDAVARFERAVHMAPHSA
jgi:hypothetical protein